MMCGDELPSSTNRVSAPGVGERRILGLLRPVVDAHQFDVAREGPKRSDDRIGEAFSNRGPPRPHANRSLFLQVSRTGGSFHSSCSPDRIRSYIYAGMIAYFDTQFIPPVGEVNPF